MMTTRPLRVVEIWRYPVKSMGGEQMESTEVGSRGMPLDRGWAVRDERAGAIRSARYLPKLLLCSARYIANTDAGLVPHVEITLPHGDTIRSDDVHANDHLSQWLGKPVTLWPLQPVNEVEHLRLGPGAMVTGDVASEMRMMFGLEPSEPLPDISRVPAPLLRELTELAAPRGTYFDAFPIDILAAASIRHLQRHLPWVDLDVRRFRPNFLLDDGSDGNDVLEREWIGHSVRIGSAELDVIMECPRCTMIAAEQLGGLPRDPTITRTIVREMAQCLSAYCNVRNPGHVKVGDVLTLLP
ncbi:MOSC domain-containing protein [Sphingomonas profundi]|uniref:MOSC domain-containing protein n=1 Tax=Alterirhizorhabdus profundi TaxID=2681549 RepID=UPI0012E82EC5|nr:MOSC N-terminal beta barrel domain-containing protein [Sphingomonas profundi]